MNDEYSPPHQLIAQLTSLVSCSVAAVKGTLLKGTMTNTVTGTSLEGMAVMHRYLHLEAFHAAIFLPSRG